MVSLPYRYSTRFCFSFFFSCCFVFHLLRQCFYSPANGQVCIYLFFPSFLVGRGASNFYHRNLGEPNVQGRYVVRHPVFCKFLQDELHQFAYLFSCFIFSLKNWTNSKTVSFIYGSKSNRFSEVTYLRRCRTLLLLTRSTRVAMDVFHYMVFHRNRGRMTC